MSVIPGWAFGPLKLLTPMISPQQQPPTLKLENTVHYNIMRQTAGADRG